MPRAKPCSRFQSKTRFFFHQMALCTFVFSMGISPVFANEEIELHLQDRSEFELPPPVSGRPVALASIIPQDVHSRVMMVWDALESIRFEMGVAPVEETEMTIQNAQPHDVYFLSRTLFKKIDRLVFELTGRLGATLSTQPPEEIRPFHVWHKINASLERLLIARHQLNISDPLEEKLSPASTEPADVFKKVVLINRLANQMLVNAIFPSEVYQEVTLSIHYAGALIVQFPEGRPIPASAPLEKGKTPYEVYQLLLELLKKTQEIVKRSGYTPLQVGPKEITQDEFTPSVLDDLATGIASELAFLYSKTGNTTQLFISPFPDLKFPSHVFQRANILRTQLDTLAQSIQKHPRWLGE